MSRIARANGLRNWHKLRQGQRLEIPVTASSVATKQPVAASNPNVKKTIYTVRPGDTLGQIAEAHYVGLSRLRGWNGLRPGTGHIRVGQKLVVWTPTNPPRQQPAPLVPDGMVQQFYTVRPGDTFGRIAEVLEVRLSMLQRWNGLRPGSGNIRVGQKLVIYRPEG